MKPYRIELPLVYDFEYDSVNNAESHGVKITKAVATSFATAFLDEIEKGGYWALNYSNLDFLQRLYDLSLTNRFGLWLAAWPSKAPDLKNPPRPCDIWQWGPSIVPGITGSVDTNECYKDFPALIQKAGLNHLVEDQTALKWAQEMKLVEGDSDMDKAIALALWRYDKEVNK